VPDADVLFHAHRQHIFRYLCRILGQADAASDLTQEVFLRVARTQVPETGESGRRAWLFRIARNLALNHLRDGRRRPEPVPLADAATPPTQELAIAIDRALATLDALDRDVFLMRETAGLSYQEIADACELSIDAVRSRLHRARLQLRRDLDAAMTMARTRPIRLGSDVSDGDRHD
jgi:RNA polymerase sigma-70 factor (ECF subfamily)